MIKKLRFFSLAIAIIIFTVGALGSREMLLAQQPVISHPLTALTSAEIETAVTVVKKDKNLTDKAVFPLITLQEPNKQEVINFTPGKSFQRQAFLVAYETEKNQTYEAVVDLKTQILSSWKQIPNAQPAIINSEYGLAAKIVKSDLQWQAAMQKRGITDFDKVKINCWAAGILTDSETAKGKRICRALSYYKGKHWNYFASPIEGVLATVDLNTGKIDSFIDNGVVPLSQQNWNYDIQSLGKLLSPPKLLKFSNLKVLVSEYEVIQLVGKVGIFAI